MLCPRTGWEPGGAGKGCSAPDAFGPEDGKNCDERKGSLSGGRNSRRPWKSLRAGVHSGEVNASGRRALQPVNHVMQMSSEASQWKGAEDCIVDFLLGGVLRAVLGICIMYANHLNKDKG